MKPLSDRIEQADYDCETLWRYLEEAGHPPDGDAINTLKSVMQTLLDCERLAKRYEDAATGECVEAGSMPGMEGDPFVGIIIESTPDELKRGPAIVYKRVRIVLDKEG